MSTSTMSKVTVPGKRLVTTFVVAEAFLLLGNLAVRISQRYELLPSWSNIAVALVTVVPMIWFAFQFFRMLRSETDEMIQRVIMEGLTFAMVAFIPLAAVYVNLRTCELLKVDLNPPELLLIPSILGAVGIMLAWSRFK